MFFKRPKPLDTYQLAVNVLDTLLQIKINGDVINKNNNIDLDFYNFLNSVEVNNQIVHLGLLPIFKNNKKPENDFIDFMEKLILYISYDINHDSYYFNYVDDLKMQKIIIKKITNAKMVILDYIQKKGLIDESKYKSFLESGVKSFAENW